MNKYWNLESRFIWLPGESLSVWIVGRDSHPTAKPPLVSAIARGKRIVATDGIGVAPLAMSALNAHFAATMVANDLLRGVFGFALSAVDTASALRISALHRPIISMADNVPIIF